MYFTCTSFSMHKNEKREKKKETGTHVVTGHALGKKKEVKKGIGWFKLRICNFLHIRTLVYTAKMSGEALN